jgi:FAD/FMN-containing dehydrogenase
VRSFNPLTNKHPLMIVRCADANDVARSILFAREQSLETAVRSGGHDILGASVCEGGMVIDLSRMNGIAIDSQRHTSRVEGGVRAGSLNTATQPYGLAAALGCRPGVGIAGLTLRGGLGWLIGKHGTACDNLRG